MHKDNGVSFSSTQCFLKMNWLIIGIFLASLSFIVFKTLDGPLLDFLKNTCPNFLYIVEIIAQGLLTSSIFYFILIGWPLFRQKIFLKKLLFDTYLDTKRSIIITLYQAVQGRLPDHSKEKELLTQNGFSKYFDAETDDGNSMLIKSLNIIIDKCKINDLVHELNFLKITLNSILFQLNISTGLHLSKINSFSSEVDKLYYDFQNQTETIDRERLNWFLRRFLSDYPDPSLKIDRCDFLELIKDL